MYSRRTAKRETQPTGRRDENVTVEIENKASITRENKQINLWGEDATEMRHRMAKERPANLEILDSQRIHGRNKLTKYLPQGNIFRSVGYDWNCSLILEIVNKNGYQKSTVIVGYNMSGTNEDEYTIASLYELIDEGRLEIRIPKKGTWHEKFFFIEGEDEESLSPFWIDVNGSPNPTITGTGKRGNQSNRITRICYAGDYQNEPYVQKAELDWQWYIDNSVPFEEDLFQLLNNSEKEDHIKTITKYYSGEISSFGDDERAPVEILKAKVGGELLKESKGGSKVIKMQLGDYPSETVDTFLTSISELGFETRPSIDGTVELPVSLLDSTQYTTEQMPWMQILDGAITIRSDGKTFSRTNRDFDSISISEELSKLENYVETIENSHLPGLKTKMALSEYLLAGLCAPFDHMWMNIRKSKFTRITEGPQMTSYVGISGNGKSFASRYLLKMLTGMDLDPLSSKQFTEAMVCGVAKSGSIMPLIFDDLKRDRIRQWDKWGKFYWDNGYASGHPFSQLLVTANDRIDSSGPLGRRVREIWMDATFENNGKNTEIVENCLANCSNIFPVFSAMIIDMYFENNTPYEHNDPLKIGREVLKKLYKIAKRKVPDWWCPSPYEECVDTNAYMWFDILNKDLFKIKRKLDSFVIEIEESPHDIKERLKGFPAHLQARKAGLAISIGNAEALLSWLNGVRHLYTIDKGKPVRRMRKLLNRGI